jgi:site-specific DNA-cytosine methylase
MREIVKTVLCPFGGSGGGARGFLDAEVTLFDHRARFRCLGSIDLDPEGCADFELLTGSPAWQVDLGSITARDLIERYGERAPDCVFLSPPCKGASGLLSEEKAKTPRYRAMSGLALTWMRKMLEAWGSDPPGLVLLENVPRLASREKTMLGKVRGLLRRAGYVLHEGFHDCGELGGLAQHRRRYLLVARLPRKVPPILYQPPKRRVRACGEVIGPMPLPHDPAGGPMHVLPRLSWLNWVRLALIPAGGDWRDLPGVLEAGEKRREKWGRHGVAAWEQSTGAVAGPGSNGVANVADPRWFNGVLGVMDFEEPSRTVIGGRSNGAINVADPRPFALDARRPARHYNKYRVEAFDAPAHTVIGATRPGSGAPAIADARPRGWFKGALGVRGFDESSGAICGETWPQNGAYSVADPRVSRAFDAGYAVLDWTQAARTIAGKSSVGCGAFSVADPRIAPIVPGLRRVTEDELERAAARPDKPPPFIPVIIADDGTWHRPLTTLELAALQSFPTSVHGAPLKLTGDAVSRWRERIGNAVPVATARAIAEQMLVALAQAELETMALSCGDVWVRPSGHAEIAT